MFNPISTYRIQFHSDFRFADLNNIIDYLGKLSIKTLYASPVFRSVEGSKHGYDGIDPSAIDAEIGTKEEFQSLARTLHERGIGWLQDIVPNHQAFSLQNPWILDLLKHGRKSKYAVYFDIDWDHPGFDGTMMLPFLGQTPDKLILDKKLKAVLKDGQLSIDADGQLFPVREDIQDLPTDPELINNDPSLLRRLLESQHYRLAYWADTDRVLNFRRFFTVNGLISLNIHKNEVFDHFHETLFSLVSEGLIDGIRVDHIDGLYDPLSYLERLRTGAGEDKYIVVEKILQANEQMPYWPVQGNTGYDFLAMVNNLFTQKKSAAVFQKKYAKFAEVHAKPATLRKEKKRAILNKNMAGDLDNLYDLFSQLDPGFISTLTTQESLQLKTIIAEILIDCPVYRFYPLDADDRDTRAFIQSVLDELDKSTPALHKMVMQMKDMLLVRTQGLDEKYNERALHFLRRCMQFTGPLMAKGVEDTLMYTYNFFIAHNEVGDDVESFGIVVEDFHELMKQRKENSPLSMNATATHDTKRGEDSRARLNVLSEIPERWFQAVKHWREINEEILDKYEIHPNDEYFIYQVLIGAYPCMNDDEQTLVARVQEYLVKALREAKLRSNWKDPDEKYEENVKALASYLLLDDGPFRESFRHLLDEIMDAGIINSLSQLTLKFTCPGMPDTYQGTELWDFSLVDPDNRRPVDYQLRQELLKEIDADLALSESEAIKKLWDERRDGSIKLYLTRRLMELRAEFPALFAEGAYIPLKTKGKHSENIFAFARNHGKDWLITVIPLFPSLLLKEGSFGEFDWRNTRIILPKSVPAEVKDLLANKQSRHNGELYARDLFRLFPVALLRPEKQPSARSAGILLSVTSLPSAFGAGDIGPAAYEFAGKLKEASQRYWQLLPLNPVERATDYAPYSSFSAMAGNTLLISPEILVKEGLLQEDNLTEYREEFSHRAFFETAESGRELLFQKAWENHVSAPFPDLQKAFQIFCDKHRRWLHDHALYTVLKFESNGKSWTDWSEPYRNREKKALSEFESAHAGAMEKEKWLQFIFDRQFSALKSFCNTGNIKLIGDLPFYVSHDSADVWANQSLFELDSDGSPIAVAGVPPDYFNEDGQLWGMPIFNWSALKESGYTWWLDRIERNLEMVDLLRLDHFRAFAGFWNIPAGEATARNGEWIKGPGNDLFEKIEERFPGMPFIAEDLGEITPDVYELRDNFKLPGMRVLQFAFGDDIAVSVNTPHNYDENSIAYTGTHDNNTAKGWFRKDAQKLHRKNLARYTGSKITEKNVHETLVRLIYGSVSRIAIVPMQDVLGLDESARMNTPAVAGNQWRWRMMPADFSEKMVRELFELTRFYNRD